MQVEATCAVLASARGLARYAWCREPINQWQHGIAAFVREQVDFSDKGFDMDIFLLDSNNEARQF